MKKELNFDRVVGNLTILLSRTGAQCTNYFIFHTCSALYAHIKYVKCKIMKLFFV